MSQRMVSRGFVIALALAVSACFAPMRVEQTLSGTFGDVSNAKIVEIQDAGGHVLLRGELSAPTAVDVKTTKKATRTAVLSSPNGTGPTGTAEIEIDRHNGFTEELIDVALEALPYPMSCRLLLDGRDVLTFWSTKNGRLDLRLNRRVTSGTASAAK